MSRIEEGIYKGRAIAGSEQYGKTSNGNDQIVLELELDGGEKVSTFLVFSDKAAPYSIQRLRKCGWTGDNLTDLAGIDANEVDVEVRYEEYQGKMNMKVQIVTSGGVVLEKQFDAKEKKAFGAKYAKLAASTPIAKPVAAAKPRPLPSSKPVAHKATGFDDAAGDFGDDQGSGDDIPF